MELYSDSKRNLERIDIFVYDKVSDKFKNNLFYFIKDYLTIVELVQIYKKITKAYGLGRDISETYLNKPNTFQDGFISGFEKLIYEEDSIDFYLDLIVLFLNEVTEDKTKTISSLNKILYKYSLGYQIDKIKDQIIRVDSKHIYKEGTKKVLLLLNDIEFENVDDEYRKAYEELKNGNYESVLVEANKAFESTMKIICELKKYGLPKKHNASALIAHLRENDFIENFQDEKFNGLAKTLQSPAIARNNQAGHGQGNEKRELPLIFAEYALQVTAANILLLIGIYNKST